MWNDHELSKITGKDIPFPMLSDQNGNIGKLYGFMTKKVVQKPEVAL